MGESDKRWCINQMREVEDLTLTLQALTFSHDGLPVRVADYKI